MAKVRCKETTIDSFFGNFLIQESADTKLWPICIELKEDGEVAYWC